MHREQLSSPTAMISEKETDSLSQLYTDPLSPQPASPDPRVLAGYRHNIVRNIQSNFMNSQDSSQGHSKPEEYVEVPYVPLIERTDLCSQTLVWWQHLPQLHGETTLFSGIPDATNTLGGCLPKTGGMMPESRELSQEWPPEACPSMIPDGFNGYPWDGSGTFSNVETDVNGADWGITIREEHKQLVGRQPRGQEECQPFAWGSNVQLLHLRANSTPDDIPPNRLSRQQLGGTLELNDTRQNLEPESVRNPKHDGKASPKRNRCAECGKQYRRSQELKRHKRDRHEQLRKCPFCRAKWSRPERIRAHIITDHRGRFNEKGHQEIRRLRGLTDTIHFLTECESRVSPRSNMFVPRPLVHSSPVGA